MSKENFQRNRKRKTKPYGATFKNGYADDQLTPIVNKKAERRKNKLIIYYPMDYYIYTFRSQNETVFKNGEGAIKLDSYPTESLIKDLIQKDPLYEHVDIVIEDITKLSKQEFIKYWGEDI